MSFTTFLKVPFTNSMLGRIAKQQPRRPRDNRDEDFAATLIREALTAREAKAESEKVAAS